MAGLIRALAAELGGTGITANAVSPASTDTPILAGSARLDGLPGAESSAVQQPVRRLLGPDEIAAALVWLAGEDTSVTGAMVPVGGELAPLIRLRTVRAGREARWAVPGHGRARA